ncbi:MAG: phage holin family protein [Burkholderiaceae bacterium]
MIHPLFRLIAREPHLVAEHVQAYAALLSEQVGAAADSFKQRLILMAVAGVLLLIGIILSGVALMLWGASEGSMRAPWALFVGPLVPLVAGVGCLLAAKGKPSVGPLDKVREQLSADISMLREVNAS